MSGRVIWITGLSGSGKTTVAAELCQRLNKLGPSPVLLDGDILRNIFKEADKVDGSYIREQRITLSRKYGLLCKDLSSQGFTVIIATVSMFSEIYAWNRANLPNYFEVFLDIPIEELRLRDPKKIYESFFSGATRNVAGLDLKIDQPTNAHLVIDFQSGQTKEEIVDIIHRKLNLTEII